MQISPCTPPMALRSLLLHLLHYIKHCDQQLMTSHDFTAFFKYLFFIYFSYLIHFGFNCLNLCYLFYIILFSFEQFCLLNIQIWLSNLVVILYQRLIIKKCKGCNALRERERERERERRSFEDYTNLSTGPISMKPTTQREYEKNYNLVINDKK